MKFTFLGSGSAFVLGKENYHSSVLVESGDDNLLIDAGTTTPDALEDLGLTPMDIKSIFITHTHADHMGGLEYIGYKTYFNEFPFGKQRPKLYGHNTVLDRAWFYGMRAGMGILNGVKHEARLDTYFDTKYLMTYDDFVMGSCIVSPMKTEHVKTHSDELPSYGLVICDDSTKTNCIFSGDMKFDRELFDRYYSNIDLIFQDCDIAEYPNGVHAQYHELKTLPDSIKAKMWLYHYTTKGGTVELPDAVADGFLGFVKRGDTFDC